MKYRHIVIAAMILTMEAGAQPIMNLRINDAIETTTGRGTPIVLTAIVLDEHAQTQQAINAANSAERELLAGRLAAGELTQEQYQTALADLDTVPVPTYTFGSPGAPWHRRIIWRMQTDGGRWQPLPWNLHLLLLPPAEDAGIVNGVDVVAAAYGVDPDETEQLRAGTYLLQGALPPGTAAGLADTLWSNRATLIVRERGKGGANYDESRWLALYWLRRGEYQRALDLATQLGRERPDDINLYEIRGDALVGLGRPAEASAQYARGIELYYARKPQPYEPPDLLIDKLNAIAAKPESRK